MNILYLLFSFTTGGTERLVSDICNEMVRREHNVHLYIVNDLYETSMLDTLDSRVRIHLQKRPVGGGDKLGTLQKVARYIRDNKIDVVHCNSFSAPELLLLKPIFFPKVTVIHTIHGMGQYKTLSRLKCFARNLLCDRFVAISESVKNDMLTYGADPKKVCTVFNAIDLSKFTPAKKPDGDPVVIGNVARIAPEIKGQDILLDALSILRRKGVNFACYLAGAADDAHKADFLALQEQAAQLGLQDRVTFLGNVADIPAFLATLDIFVLPSRSEGFGISLVEAMAMGIPCIASRLEGPAEVLQNGTLGTLFHPGDSNDLAQQLEQLIHDLTMHKEKAANSVPYIRNTYNIVNMCDRLEQIMK